MTAYTWFTGKSVSESKHKEGVALLGNMAGALNVINSSFRKRERLEPADLADVKDAAIKDMEKMLDKAISSQGLRMADRARIKEDLKMYILMAAAMGAKYFAQMDLMRKPAAKT